MSTMTEDRYEAHIREVCERRRLPMPEREVQFAPPRKWRFDFAWREHKVAVEVEGGVWLYGRHNRAGGFIADMEKYNEAAAMGWRVIRVTPQLLYGQQFESWLTRALDADKGEHIGRGELGARAMG